MCSIACQPTDQDRSACEAVNALVKPSTIKTDWILEANRTGHFSPSDLCIPGIRSGELFTIWQGAPVVLYAGGCPAI